MRTWWAGTLVVALAAVAAAADEVVYFKNGSQMAAHRHTVEDGMVHVVLGKDSVIAFPLEMVERIEQADGTIRFDEAGAAIKNQRVNGPEAPVIDTAVGGRPLAHQIRGKWIGNELADNPQVVRDSKTGLAAYRPFIDDPRPRVSSRQVVGRLDMLAGAAKTGDDGDATTPIGARPFGKGSVGKMPDDARGNNRKMRFAIK